MFSETELGAGSDYQDLIRSIPFSVPVAVYQLNLGRVTDANMYNQVVKEFDIPINWKENYKDTGNRNDVLLAAGALYLKYQYAKTIQNNNFTNDMWFNAVVSYKGVSAEGARKANLVWKLFATGAHPYTKGVKLF